MGVDACKAGWVGIVLGDGVAAYFGTTIAALAEQAGQVRVIAVDMPIGLPDTGHRAADKLVLDVVRARRSSVFLTPTRTALEAADHATATRINVANGGPGISQQAFGLRAKLREVDAWVRDTAHEVVEAHPEVSFATAAGGPLATGKKTWAGAAARRAILADAGIALPDDLGEPGRVAAVDDVLDAAIVAWTARRVAAGDAVSYPDPPEVFSDGLPAAIWA